MALTACYRCWVFAGMGNGKGAWEQFKCKSSLYKPWGRKECPIASSLGWIPEVRKSPRNRWIRSALTLFPDISGVLWLSWLKPGMYLPNFGGYNVILIVHCFWHTLSQRHFNSRRIDISYKVLLNLLQWICRLFCLTGILELVPVSLMREVLSLCHHLCQGQRFLLSSSVLLVPWETTGWWMDCLKTLSSCSDFLKFSTVSVWKG